MRLLSFRESPGIDTPAGPDRDPRAWLFHEDRARYSRWVDHLTGDDRRLREWAPMLREGTGVVVLTGQQPALLGGPLYTLYKTLTAMEAARRLRAEGIPAIAAFWCVGDDTDIGEVSWASWPLRNGPPRRVRDERPRQGERIGLLPWAGMDEALRLLREDWPRHKPPPLLTDPVPGGWSAFLVRSLRFLCGEEPLLFIDGNDPETILTSQPWLRRFLNRRGEIAEGIAGLAAGVRRTGLVPPLDREEAMRALFVVEGRGRRALDPAEGDVGPDKLLLPNVVLRPALQEYLLPVARVICGEGEIAYRQLLGPVYELERKSPAPWTLRFSATLFPPGWLDLERGPDPLATLELTDDAIDAMAREWIGPTLPEEVRAARSRILRELEALGSPLGKLDGSLSQLLDSVRGKVDYQIRRIEEGILTKARATLMRRYPVLANLRETLAPRGRPQDRSLSLWTPFVVEGMRGIQDLERVVDAWFERGMSGHALLALEERGDSLETIPVEGR